MEEARVHHGNVGDVETVKIGEIVERHFKSLIEGQFLLPVKPPSSQPEDNVKSVTSESQYLSVEGEH